MCVASTSHNNLAYRRGCLLYQTPVYIGEEVYARCSTLKGKHCLPCTQLRALEAEIETAKVRTDELLDKHRRLRTELNQSHDPIVQRMPPEIIYLIFQHATPDTWSLHQDRPEPSRHDITAPLDLAAVCRTWRKIAFDTPHLWKSIRIRIHTKPDHIMLSATNEAKLNVFQQWLSRAGQLPLSIYLEILTSVDGPFDEEETAEVTMRRVDQVHCRPFFDILNDISHRLQDLTVICPRESLDILTGNSKGMSQIRRLSLIPLHHPEILYVEDAFKFEITTGLLSLLVLRLNNLSFDNTKVDWSQLTQFNSLSISVEDCYQVIKQCPRITHCYFRQIKGISLRTAHRFDSFPLLLHTRLQVLEIFHGYDQMDIIDKLTLPSLHDLKLDFNDKQGPDDRLLSFIKRSLCTLNSLSLHRARFSEDKLIKLLMSQPFIETLDIHPSSYAPYYSGSINRTLLNSLAEKSSLLPNLRSFSHTMQKSRTFPWGIIPDILGPLPRPLYKVEIGLDCFCLRSVTRVDMSVIKRLIDMQAAGVTLVIPWDLLRSKDL